MSTPTEQANAINRAREFLRRVGSGDLADPELIRLEAASIWRDFPTKRADEKRETMKHKPKKSEPCAILTRDHAGIVDCCGESSPLDAVLFNGNRAIATDGRACVLLHVERDGPDEPFMVAASVLREAFDFAGIAARPERRLVVYRDRCELLDGGVLSVRYHARYVPAKEPFPNCVELFTVHKPSRFVSFDACLLRDALGAMPRDEDDGDRAIVTIGFPTEVDGKPLLIAASRGVAHPALGLVMPVSLTGSEAEESERCAANVAEAKAGLLGEAQA